MSYIYLASPYSHPEADRREKRFKQVCECAAYYMHRGEHIFSPIAHSHPIALAGDLPKHFDYWADYDRVMLRHAKALWILIIEGWLQSEGVKQEVLLAKEFGIPVYLVVPDLEKGNYQLEDWSNDDEDK